MKKIKKLILFGLLCIVSIGASAYDFEVNGIYYNITSKTDLTCEVTCKSILSSNTYRDSVNIPDSVTNDGITYSVTGIGSFTFQKCADLTSIEIPSSVTLIGNYAFAWCNGLTTIEIPNSVISIGDGAFYFSVNLTSINIPNSVTTIGKGVFQNCSGLKSITIGNSVTSIGGSAFEGCSGLTSIVIDKDNKVYDSRDNCHAIIETATNTLITGCRNTIIPNSVISIGDGAFRSCTGLTSIEIPNSVTSIGENAFSGCRDLTSIVIDKDNKVYDSRDNCHAIIETATNTLITGCRNTIIPNSVISIGDGAFRSCSGLTSIEIPNSVTSIGIHAFFDCSGLTSVTIPNSVISIEKSAFQGCI